MASVCDDDDDDDVGVLKYYTVLFKLCIFNT